MAEPRIVRVVSTHPPSQGAWVEINESDFDSKVHVLYDEAPDTTPVEAPDQSPVEAPKRRGRPPKSLTEKSDGNR